MPVLDAFAHDGFKVDRALNHLYFNQDGVFGIMANVLVTYVILFIFFGSFLKASGASRFFLDLPLALAGKTVGGPAKVAVIASGFFGSVSGSAIANTVSTGAFTIPMMKKAGFRPHVAGAIEPSASIGGMFMPPIMGAGGFLMAEMTEIPYVEIMKMAIFPAVMYFLSVFVMIHFEAKRYGLVGIREDRRPHRLADPQEGVVPVPAPGDHRGHDADRQVAGICGLLVDLSLRRRQLVHPGQPDGLAGNLRGA